MLSLIDAYVFNNSSFVSKPVCLDHLKTYFLLWPVNTLRMDNNTVRIPEHIIISLLLKRLPSTIKLLNPLLIN